MAGKQQHNGNQNGKEDKSIHSESPLTPSEKSNNYYYAFNFFGDREVDDQSNYPARGYQTQD
jgi:hypothetical protein